MQSFTYERPSKVEDAMALLAGPQAYALAGGTDLIPQLKERRKAARVVVDLKHIPQLTKITRSTDGGWQVGSAVSVARMGAEPGLAKEYEGLVAAAGLIGSLQIQSRATLGGNLCNGAPSADAVPLLVSIGAKAIVAGPQGQRTIAVEAVPIGPGRTSLLPGELLVALLLPPRQERSGARYLRFTPRREMDIAIAGAGVALSLGDDGAIRSAGITLASVAPVPLKATRAEARLVGQVPSPALLSEAARIAASEAKPISDTRASSDYRRHLVEVLTRRALEVVIAEARAGDEA